MDLKSFIVNYNIMYVYMDIFCGRSIEDLLLFYDKRGDKTMVKKIHELIVKVSEDLDGDFKYVTIDCEGEECEPETMKIKKSNDGFFSLD